ncbi:MetQ/NlpA family ABC transporter substrate-binding protein [Actinoallomurus sp. CA-142502]|uniref:MetQ/NlpA family ABC transporter substrate-binding protein n=1 Tax=Actinoallomurus sp. CA-142502 TaxID=3239885 RepID=UPI003D90781C
MSESPTAGDPVEEPRLPERRSGGGRRVTWIVSAVVVAVIVVVAIVVGVTGGSSDAKTVRVGVADASEPYWKTFAALAKKRLNVTVTYVNFNDYSQPNPALKEKQLDLNEFQHIQYLANYNVTAHDDLQPIGATAVYPLPLYSLKYRTPDALPDGAKVAVPNDAINEARGLLVLQAAKLVTLKNGGTAFSSVSDITSHRVDVVTLDASQTARAVLTGSAAAAIVNNNYATNAKLPKTNAIFQDDPASPIAAPYVNIFVARAADKDDPTYLKLAALYHDPSVEKGVQASNGGTAVFRDVPAATLQQELKTVEAQARAAGK